MYDELVGDLRYCDKGDCNGCRRHINTGSCYTLLREAADAIEELSKPRWIPATERLPDTYEDVLLKFPNNLAVGFVDRDGCWGVYSGDDFYTEVAENDPPPTHWTQKLPEPPEEGDND